MTVYRKLRPAELPRYKGHLLRLDHKDRYSRFSGTVSDDYIDRHCARLDWRYTIIVGCFIDGVLRGAVELRTDPNLWPDNAELAISVEKRVQSRGLGRELMRRSLTVARNRSIRTVHLVCLASNRRMQALARAYRGTVTMADGEAVAAIVMEWPNQTSFMLEAFEDGNAALAVMLEGMQRGNNLLWRDMARAA